MYFHWFFQPAAFVQTARETPRPHDQNKGGLELPLADPRSLALTINSCVQLLVQYSIPRFRELLYLGSWRRRARQLGSLPSTALLLPMPADLTALLALCLTAATVTAVNFR